MMAVLKWMLKLALFPLLLLLILAQWVGIFLTTFSTILTNLLAGLFFFVALASWVMKLADGGEVLKMLITACRRTFQHPERPLHQPHRDPWYLRCGGAHGFPQR